MKANAVFKFRPLTNVFCHVFVVKALRQPKDKREEMQKLSFGDCVTTV